MSDLRYLGERDIPSLIAYARRAFRDRPAYDIESSQAFLLRGADGERLLASALAAPQWHYYETLAVKAAVLHDRLNKLHPFVDGNKRFALTAMLVFLGRNNSLLIALDDELLEFSLAVADGRLDQEAACNFAALRVFERDWSEAEIGDWRQFVDQHGGEGERIAEALKSWRQRQGPNVIQLPGTDLESALRLAGSAT